PVEPLPRLDDHAERRIAPGEPVTLGEETRLGQRHRPLGRQGLVRTEDVPGVAGDEGTIPVEGHQALLLSTPALETWMPHSILAEPRQRPARGSSPAATGVVQGAQPIEG